MGLPFWSHFLSRWRDSQLELDPPLPPFVAAEKALLFPFFLPLTLLEGVKRTHRPQSGLISPSGRRRGPSPLSLAERTAISPFFPARRGPRFFFFFGGFSRQPVLFFVSRGRTRFFPFFLPVLYKIGTFFPFFYRMLLPFFFFWSATIPAEGIFFRPLWKAFLDFHI